MPRQKAYSRDQFLGQAVDLFWNFGFEATSIQDIVNHTGLNKRSMYDEFGSKEKLYGQVLHHYQKKQVRRLANILQTQPLGLQNLRDFFDQVESMEKDRGCLLVNSVAEKKSIGDENQKICQEFFAELESLFQDNILQGQANGEISSQTGASELARFLRVVLQGLSIEYKKNSPLDQCSGVVNLAFRALNILN